MSFGVVDKMVPEPTGGARDHDAAASMIKEAIAKSLAELKKKSVKKLLDDRYARFRKLGEFEEKAV